MFRKRANSCPSIIYSKNIVPEAKSQLPSKAKQIFNNYVYHFNSEYKGNYYYRCSDKNCGARLTFKIKENAWDTSKTHTCNTKLTERPFVKYTLSTEVELFVKERVGYHATNLSLTPDIIYETVLSSLAEKYKNSLYRDPLKSEIKSLIKKLRQSSMVDVEKIEEIPLCNTYAGPPFFRGKYSLTWGDKSGSCIFWASYEAINLLKASDQLFIDCTFKCVPRQFKQLLIIMGHHVITNMYFPGTRLFNKGVFVLMDTKCQEAYEIVFFIFKQWIGVENIPKKVTTNFEMGLTNSLEKVFPVDIEYIGCYFHFKQALSRKFKDLKCSDEETEFLNRKIGFLALINEDEISLGLDFFKEKCQERFPNLSGILSEFCAFFLGYWFPKFRLWNISRFPAKNQLKRTNNCLERYNRY